LSPEAQQRVRRLAAILRLAGGFDRSHSGQVRDVVVERGDGDRLSMEVVAPENPDVDIWSARRRAKMFENVFETSLSIHWQGEAQTAMNESGAAPAE
jgi:hypothetical protein